MCVFVREREMAAADGSEWIQEAVVRFLQGPCYTAPLMGFIDENCTIFDTEEENKFEYSNVHEEFKKTVETLIADFLEEIGVTGEEFVAAVGEGASSRKLSSFVLSSILTVDDFLQFKAMMVKRNMDLTEEVIRALEAGEIGGTDGEAKGDANEETEPQQSDGADANTSTKAETDASPSLASSLNKLLVEENSASSSENVNESNAQAQKTATPMHDSEKSSCPPIDDRDKNTMDKEEEELARALALSKEQFAVDEERRSKPTSSGGSGTGSSSSEEAELSLAMRRSLLERCRIETERAELEQAIALSLALEAERERLEMEYSKEEELQMERSRLMDAKALSSATPAADVPPDAPDAAQPTEPEDHAPVADGGELGQGEFEMEEEKLEKKDETTEEKTSDASPSEEGNEEPVVADVTKIEECNVAAKEREEDEQPAKADDDVADAKVDDDSPVPAADASPPPPNADVIVTEDAKKESAIAAEKSNAPDAAENRPPTLPALKKGRAQPMTLPALPLKEQKQLELMRSQSSSEMQSTTSAALESAAAMSLHSAPRPLHTLRRGSGFSSSSATSTTAAAKPGGMHIHEVRAAASAAASSQKALLVRRAAAAAQAKTKVPAITGAGMSDREKSQAEFFAQQRRELVARKARERQAELDRFLDTERANNKENKPRLSPTRSAGITGKEKSGLLQAELAKTVKHELISRLAAEGQASS